MLDEIWNTKLQFAQKTKLFSIGNSPRLLSIHFANDHVTRASLCMYLRSELKENAGIKSFHVVGANFAFKTGNRDNRIGICIPRYNEPWCVHLFPLCRNDHRLSTAFIDDQSEKWKVVEINRAVVASYNEHL